MSCDDNKEARAKDREQRRSLPIVNKTVAAPAASGDRLWRSLEERDRVGAMPGAANEFPAGTTDVEDNVSRRGFMQMLSVSTAVATVGAACMKPNEKIVPFVRRPEEVTPGNPLHFATAYALDGYGSGLLVESHEVGRRRSKATPRIRRPSAPRRRSNRR